MAKKGKQVNRHVDTSIRAINAKPYHCPIPPCRYRYIFYHHLFGHLYTHHDKWDIAYAIRMRSINWKVAIDMKQSKSSLIRKLLAMVPGITIDQGKTGD